MTHPRIYVIDDDQAMLDSTAFLLRASGIDCACFSDPVQFLASLEDLQPGCVLTDLRMPEMNGYDLQRALREQAPGWPIIMMTSENGSLDAETVVARGFEGYLRKPFTARALLGAIKACIPMVERLTREVPKKSEDH